MEEDLLNDSEEEFIPNVPEFKENIPTLKREKSHTRLGPVVKPVSSQPNVKINSQKNKPTKTKSDEEIRKELITNYKGKSRISYEMTVGGRGDMKNMKENVSGNLGDEKNTVHSHNKSSVHRTYGVLSDKQPATVINNKATEGSQGYAVSEDDINLLKQIRCLKTIKKQNVRHPESEITGKCNIECMQNYIKTKEYLFQEGIKANW